jgi:hypothetical protein
MAKPDKKADVKAKVGKKVRIVDAKKLIPSAKYDAPISSVEILARVCIYLEVSFPLSLPPSHIYLQAQRKSVKKSKKKDEVSEESTESSSEDEKPAAKHPLTNGKVRSATYLSLEMS